MLVSAIGLLAGDRADPSVVRPGADEAVVQGRFVRDDDEIVLTRVVPRNGRSRAYRDGQLVTAARAGRAGRLPRRPARAALPRRAPHDRQPAAGARSVRVGRSRRSRGGPRRGASGRRRARGPGRRRRGPRARARLPAVPARRDRPRGSHGPGEDERLEADESLLADADAHRAAAGAADAALDTEAGSPRPDLGRARRAGVKAPFRPIVERLQGVAAELDDVAHDLRTTADAIDEDPERLAAVQARRAALADLRRRYTPPPARAWPTCSRCGMSWTAASPTSPLTPSERRRPRRPTPKRSTPWRGRRRSSGNAAGASPVRWRPPCKLDSWSSRCPRPRSRSRWATTIPETTCRSSSR